MSNPLGPLGLVIFTMSVIPAAIDPKNLASLVGCLAVGVAVQTQIDPAIDLDSLQRTLDAVFDLIAGLE